MSEEDLRFSERYRERLQWDEDIYKTIQGRLNTSLPYKSRI